MKHIWLLGVLPALVLMTGASRNLARGDDVVLPAPTPVAAEPAVIDGADAAPRKHWYPGYLLVHPSERPSLIRYYQKQDWLCCKTTHNTLGCGSLKAECDFIFGSCRTFYGEPCLKGKQPTAGPAGAATGGPGGCTCP